MADKQVRKRDTHADGPTPYDVRTLYPLPPDHKKRLDEAFQRFLKDKQERDEERIRKMQQDALHSGD